MASKRTTAESETLEAFLPDVITAICDDIQRIIDHCLANGLISDSKHRRIFEMKGSEEQARELIQCVQNSTKTDNHCFMIFLDILDKELPRLVKERILSDMRKDLADRLLAVVVPHKTAVPGEVTESASNRTMFRSNLEDIRSRFSALLIDVRLALESNHIATSNVRTILVGMFPKCDKYIPKTNLEEIFDAATHHELWNYEHHSPVEKLVCRLLPDADHIISLIRKYKQHLSGFYAATKLIDYIQYKSIDHQQGCNELTLKSYTEEQRRKLMVTLDIEPRNITELSLKYVQDLWEQFTEEFKIPSLTAVLDSILSGSLVITWLVPLDVAEKIIISAHKSTTFFKKHGIISVTISVYSDELSIQEEGT